MRVDEGGLGLDHLDVVRAAPDHRGWDFITDPLEQFGHLRSAGQMPFASAERWDRPPR